MNGKQLKNSILQWAIQGKLVPQDPNDEPASVLLERIRDEKARLVKEKKIKKDKNESIIFRGDDNSHYEKFADGTVKCIDDEIPFEIPAGWAWCKIKHICTMQAGKNISASKIFAEYSELHPYRCVGGNGLRGYTDSYNTSGHYSIVGRQGALCGCLNIENGDFYATEHAVVVDAYDIVPTTFIYYFLTALNLNQYATATAQPGLAVSNIIEVMFPLPPIQEQRRIVEQIELIMPLVNKYEQSRSKLDSLNKTIYTQLKKSILQEAIQGKLVPQDPNDEPASVLLERIKEEKAKLFKDGKLKKKDLVDSVIFKGEDNKYYEIIDGKQTLIDSAFDFPESWQVVRLRSICLLSDGVKQTGSQVCLDAKYLRGKSSPTYLQQGKFVEKDDNIILVDGENSGEVFTAPIAGYMGSTFKQLWISGNLHLPYVLAFIRYYKDELRNSKKGAAIPHLNKEIFNNLIIGIPPYDEQVRIVDRLNSITSSLN